LGTRQVLNSYSVSGRTILVTLVGRAALSLPTFSLDNVRVRQMGYRKVLSPEYQVIEEVI